MGGGVIGDATSTSAPAGAKAPVYPVFTSRTGREPTGRGGRSCSRTPTAEPGRGEASGDATPACTPYGAGKTREGSIDKRRGVKCSTDTDFTRGLENCNKGSKRKETEKKIEHNYKTIFQFKMRVTSSTET